MPGKSSKTSPVSFRLPNEVMAILERRVKGRRSKHKTVNSYLKARVIFDTTRSHKKRRNIARLPRRE